jgi:polyamine oxidase
MKLMPCLAFAVLAFTAIASSSAVPRNNGVSQHSVLVLGGGVAGVIAARTLHERGIDDFLIIEARDELGGRMKSHKFGGHTVELGANWVQGTQVGDGPSNPIFGLAKKHSVKTQLSNYFDSLSVSISLLVKSKLIFDIATFDEDGEVDFRDVFDASVEDYAKLTVSGGMLPQSPFNDLQAAIL